MLIQKKELKEEHSSFFVCIWDRIDKIYLFDSLELTFQNIVENTLLLKGENAIIYLHIPWPKIHVSGLVFTSTKTVGVHTTNTNKSAMLKFIRKIFVEFRMSFVFIITIGTYNPSPNHRILNYNEGKREIGRNRKEEKTE